MTFEPHDEVIYSGVDLPSIPVAIRSQREVLYNGLVAWLIGKGKLARRFLASTEEIRYAFWVLFPFLQEKVFECLLISTIGCSVHLVCDEVSGQSRHGLDEASQNLIKIFILLSRRTYRAEQ